MFWETKLKKCITEHDTWCNTLCQAGYTVAVCTFIVDMWKGVAVPCMGRITVSYFWSGQQQCVCGREKGGGQGAVQLDVKHTALCLSTMTPYGTCIPTNILWFWMSPSLGNTAGFLYATVGGRFCLWEKMHDCSDFTPNTCGATGAWTTKTAIEQD